MTNSLWLDKEDATQTTGARPLGAQDMLSQRKCLQEHRALQRSAGPGGLLGVQPQGPGASSLALSICVAWKATQCVHLSPHVGQRPFSASRWPCSHLTWRVHGSSTEDGLFCAAFQPYGVHLVSLTLRGWSSGTIAMEPSKNRARTWCPAASVHGGLNTLFLDLYVPSGAPERWLELAWHGTHPDHPARGAMGRRVKGPLTLCPVPGPWAHAEPACF